MARDVRSGQRFGSFTNKVLSFAKECPVGHEHLSWVEDI